MTEKNRKRAGEIPFSWFGQTLWKYTPIYAELIFLAICLRLLGLVEPFIFQVIIDRILPFQREASLIAVIAVFAMVSIFQMIFYILSRLLGMLATNRITLELGTRIFGHLFKLPFSFFRKWSVGEVIARISETDTIHSFLVGTTTGVFLDLLFATVYIVVLVTISPQLSIIILLALPLQLLIYMGFGPFLRRRLRLQFDAGAAHQSQMVETLSGIATVKALAAEGAMLTRLKNTLAASLQAGYRAGILNMWNDRLLFALDQAITISIIYFGAQLVFSGELTLGELVAFHLLAEKVRGPIENFSSFWENWQNIRVSRQRLGDILLSPAEPIGSLPRLPSNIRGHLEFRNVTFGYDPEKPVLNGLDFIAEPGTLTLVTGPSGVGKSTFGKLAAGIEVPDEGEILLEGKNIFRFDPQDIRSRIAYVPQDSYLFSGSLRDNLTLGDPRMSEEQIIRALRIAAAEELIWQLPMGLDTPVGERGHALSGGQRQRVAIARTLLRNPAVLILDEPTSALDENAQKHMANELMKLKKTVTLIIITHAPALFTGADQIMEFKRIS